MTNTSSQPSVETLKQAIVIAEKIQRLEAELAAILGGSSIPQVTGKRRGRPAKVVDEKAPNAKKATRKKRVMSEEGRQRIIEAQKKRWAAKRKKA